MRQRGVNRLANYFYILESNEMRNGIMSVQKSFRYSFRNIMQIKDAYTQNVLKYLKIK